MPRRRFAIAPLIAALALVAPPALAAGGAIPIAAGGATPNPARTAGVPAPVAPSAPSPDTAALAAPRPVSMALAIVGVDFEMMGRSLTYSDLLSENMRRYEVLGVPMPSIRAEVFPFAQTTLPVLPDIGLAFSYARAVGLDSEGLDGSSVPTASNRLHAGLRGRMRPAGKTGPLVGVSAGIRWTDFTFEPTGELARQTASVSYVALRLGADGRVSVGPVALEAGAAYQAPLSMGELASRFREPSAGGVDFHAAVAVPFAPRFEARAGAAYTRFFYDFNSEPENEYIAGGALDQFVGVQLGVTYAY